MQTPRLPSFLVFRVRNAKIVLYTCGIRFRGAQYEGQMAMVKSGQLARRFL